MNIYTNLQIQSESNCMNNDKCIEKSSSLNYLGREIQHGWPDVSKLCNQNRLKIIVIGQKFKVVDIGPENGSQFMERSSPNAVHQGNQLFQKMPISPRLINKHQAVPECLRGDIILTQMDPCGRCMSAGHFHEVRSAFKSKLQTLMQSRNFPCMSSIVFYHLDISTLRNHKP